jgi:hypothetical protein
MRSGVDVFMQSGVEKCRKKVSDDKIERVKDFCKENITKIEKYYSISNYAKDRIEAFDEVLAFIEKLDGEKVDDKKEAKE